MKVGIVGVGLMGHGIARNILLSKAHSLTFLDHPGNQPVDELIELGARAANTPAEVASASEVVILCVTARHRSRPLLPAKTVSFRA